MARQVAESVGLSVMRGQQAATCGGIVANITNTPRMRVLKLDAASASTFGRFEQKQLETAQRAREEAEKNEMVELLQSLAPEGDDMDALMADLTSGLPADA